MARDAIPFSFAEGIKSSNPIEIALCAKPLSASTDNAHLTYDFFLEMRRL